MELFFTQFERHGWQHQRAAETLTILCVKSMSLTRRDRVSPMRKSNTAVTARIVLRGSGALAITFCVSSSVKQCCSYLTSSRGMVMSASAQLPQAYSHDSAVRMREERFVKTFSTVFFERTLRS